ncbi:MAG: hypothetical protein ABIP53_01495 [Candidatus Limnocylindrales bacterium]
MYTPDSRAHRRLFGTAVSFLVLAMLIGACGSTPSPGEQSTPVTSAPSPSNAIASSGPNATDSVSVGPITGQPVTLDTDGDLSLALSASEDADRARAREQSGFAREVGPGWDVLSEAADEATDAAAQSMAVEFAIDIPGARRNALFASVVAPDHVVSAQPASSAAALALLGAALAASQALGLGSLPDATVSESTTTTAGDSVATVTVNGTGTATVTGSRVVAEFSFDLAGTVSSIATGATVHMTGSATAHIEIDGCPDANGSSKGKVNLSSSENVASGAGWTRDITGDFDITVDDDANISRLTVDAQAQESVEPSTEEPGDGDPPTHGHELGIGTHVEYSAGPGFSGMSHDAGALGLAITHEENAQSVDIAPLFASALYSVVIGAHILGQAAERFWRDGKCIEVILDSRGGDVDANSTTTVIAKVKQRIEGNELNKPVEATLAGVKTIDPQGQKKPAPATFIYTAGAQPEEKGDIEFKSVSNRGIGKKSITFTVKSKGWTTTATDPLGSTTGTKCDGLGGDWVIEGQQLVGPLTVKIKVVVSIDETTLQGTFDFHKDQTGVGTLTTHQSNGSARIVLNEDGSVTMTLDPAKITFVATTQFGSVTTTVQGDKLTWPWTLATGEACS